MYRGSPCRLLRGTSNRSDVIRGSVCLIGAIQPRDCLILLAARCMHPREAIWIQLRKLLSKIGEVPVGFVVPPHRPCNLDKGAKPCVFVSLILGGREGIDTNAECSAPATAATIDASPTGGASASRARVYSGWIVFTA
jgi:hypothetical protein